MRKVHSPMAGSTASGKKRSVGTLAPPNRGGRIFATANRSYGGDVMEGGRKTKSTKTTGPHSIKKGSYKMAQGGEKNTSGLAGGRSRTRAGKNRLTAGFQGKRG